MESIRDSLAEELVNLTAQVSLGGQSISSV